MTRGLRFKSAFLFLWAIGVAVIWWLVPVGPRDGWQPPTDEFVCGFLSDSRTIVTLPNHAIRRRSFGGYSSGPIRLRDIETGELRASYFDGDTTFRSVRVVPGYDLLQVTRRDFEHGEHCFRLLLLHAMNGKETAAYRCDDPFENVAWVVSSDARKMAFETFDGDKSRVECRDISTGRLLATLPGYRGMMCFSPDGRRLAASTSDGKSDPFFPSIIGVWDVETGSQLAKLTKPMKPLPDLLVPRELSEHGEFLLDYRGDIWDVRSGSICMKSPKPNTWGLLLPKCRRLVMNSAGKLTFYDLEGGREVIEEAIALESGLNTGVRLFPIFRERLFLVAHWQLPPTLDSGRRWIQTKVGLSLPDLPNREFFAIIDLSSGREIMRGNGVVHCFSPDGRLVLSSLLDGTYELWNIPARKPLRWFLPWAAAWSGLVGMFAWWRARRRRVAATVPSC